MRYPDGGGLERRSPRARAAHLERSDDLAVAGETASVASAISLIGSIPVDVL
jgi:hypothetical protein